MSFNNEMAFANSKKALAGLIQRWLGDNADVMDYTIAALDPCQLTSGHFFYNRLADVGDKKRRALGFLATEYGYEPGIYDKVLENPHPVIFDIVSENGSMANGHFQVWSAQGLKQIIGCRLRIHGKNIGVIWYSLKPGFYAQKNALDFLEAITAQISIAFFNLIANNDINKANEEKAILLTFSNDVASVRDKSGLAKVIKTDLKQPALIKEYLICTVDLETRTHTGFLYDDDSRWAKAPGFKALAARKINMIDGIWDVSLYADEPRLFTIDDMVANDEASEYMLFWKNMGIKQIIASSLRYGSEYLGILWLHPDQISDFLIKGISSHLAIAIANILANEKIEVQLKEIDKYKQQLEEEKLYLQQEVSGSYSFDEIIGSGAEMQEIYEKMSQVAFANSTVLILGETGTGKELIARGIHNASPRKDKLMVKVNCASIPENLIESELFGHEKGAFTGATERRIGKFELANNGTLFLDEIGEMPLDLQVKLLRALQEKEIERIGGKSVIKINVRIIAATNRNLLTEVQEGNFRNDLFYRLNVFPIEMPPLRNRKEDISVLTRHFIQRYSRSTGKKVDGISNNVMKDLMAYDWPGNVRELEHLMERSILICKGPIIKEVHLPIPGKREAKPEPEDSYIKTMEESEREHILFVLKKCKGKIFGRGGAADLLNMHVSTLNSRIKKLGIQKELFFTVQKSL